MWQTNTVTKPKLWQNKKYEQTLKEILDKTQKNTLWQQQQKMWQNTKCDKKRGNWNKPKNTNCDKTLNTNCMEEWKGKIITKPKNATYKAT